MKYAFLIYLGDSEVEDCQQTMGAYTESVKAKGYHLVSHALHPVSSATTVRVRDGKTLVTDGPFAETKEQLGGFYLVDLLSEEAQEWAGKIPLLKHGCIEYRAVQEFD